MVSKIIPSTPVGFFEHIDISLIFCNQVSRSDKSDGIPVSQVLVYAHAGERITVLIDRNAQQCSEG